MLDIVYYCSFLTQKINSSNPLNRFLMVPRISTIHVFAITSFEWIPIFPSGLQRGAKSSLADETIGDLVG